MNGWTWMDRHGRTWMDGWTWTNGYGYRYRGECNNLFCLLYFFLNLLNDLLEGVRLKVVVVVIILSTTENMMFRNTFSLTSLCFSNIRMTY